MLRRSFVFAALVFAAAAAACGGSTAASISQCVPGQQDACACAGGGAGVQVCRADGTFEACVCPSTSIGETTPAPGGGASSSSSTSSSADAATSSSSDAGAASGTGDLADCQTGGNVLVLHGDPGDYIHPGYSKITVAQWNVYGDAIQHDSVRFDIEPSGQQFGSWWNVTFTTERLGKPLEVATYPDAERAPFASYLKPGLEVTGDGRGCNTLIGTFTIHSITWGATGIAHLAATFEQHCEKGTPALRGCVSYDAP